LSLSFIALAKHRSIFRWNASNSRFSAFFRISQPDSRSQRLSLESFAFWFCLGLWFPSSSWFWSPPDFQPIVECPNLILGYTTYELGRGCYVYVFVFVLSSFFFSSLSSSFIFIFLFIFAFCYFAFVCKSCLYRVVLSSFYDSCLILSLS
jgi:hypothetical protein